MKKMYAISYGDLFSANDASVFGYVTISSSKTLQLCLK